MINNKRVIGIIAEYDPFHNGHLKQILHAKQQLHADYVCVVMSGPFMQRGTMSMFAPAQRARMALESGADAVFELPVLFSLRDALGFAMGGVAILDALGFVDGISFGCEHGEQSALWEIAHLLEEEEEALQADIQANTKKGMPYVHLQSLAIAERLGEQACAVFQKPNNMLGLHYLRALLRLRSSLKPYPVLREGSHHSRSMDTVSPSASFLRHALLHGRLHRALLCLPPASQKHVQEALFSYHLNRKPFLDSLILHAIYSMDVRMLAEYPGIAEGLENKIKKEVSLATSVSALLERVKSRRYTLARLKRLMSYIALDIRRDALQSNTMPGYTRLLGYQKSAESLVRACNASRIPVIRRVREAQSLDLRYDSRAYHLWSLASSTNEELHTQQILHV